MRLKQTPEERRIVLPVPGNPFAVAYKDLLETIRLSPVWIHTGWIDVIWRFRRTRLGPFWHTLGLATFVLVMGTVWSTLLHQNPSHYFRYVTTGMISWGLIAAFITDGAGIFVQGQTTALSMRFPFMAFAAAHVWRALLMFCHHFVFYIFVMTITWTSPGKAGFLAVLGLCLVAANGIWLSVLSATLCLRWRDLGPAIFSGMQISIFITPVFWPVGTLGPNLAFIAEYNPLFHLVSVLREPLLGVVPPLASYIWVVITLIIGTTFTLWLYGKYRDRMPYWY